jgi:hypothetical protein
MQAADAEATVTTLVPRSDDLTASAARQLTDSIKADIEKLWARLLSAYERGVHTALGYQSFGSYMDAEFGVKYGRAYQLLDAARVAQAIEAESTKVDPPTKETVARALAPVLKTEGEKAVAETWNEVIDKHGPNPTAEETKAVVSEHKRREQKPRRAHKLTRDQIRFGRALSQMGVFAEHVSMQIAYRARDEREQTDRLLDVDDATLSEWQEHIRMIDNAARQLRRRIGNPKEATP